MAAAQEAMEQEFLREREKARGRERALALAAATEREQWELLVLSRVTVMHDCVCTWRSLSMLLRQAVSVKAGMNSFNAWVKGCRC